MIKRKLVIIGLIFMMLIFAGLHIVQYFNYTKSEEKYSEIRNIYYHGRAENILNKTNPIKPFKINENIIELKSTKNIIGWLSISGTSIDYPVMQGEDNDFYLNHNFLGEDDIKGSIFMDYRNNSIGNDSNYIIYGHKMKDGSMFSDLTKYVRNNNNNNYYEKHPTILYDTFYENTTWTIFSAYAIDLDKEDYYLYPNYNINEIFKSVIEDAYARSLIDTNIVVTDKDEIMTLVTCNYWHENGRVIIRAVRTNE